MKDLNLKSFLLSITWAFYAVSATIFLFYERMVFTEHFKEELEYIPILVIVLGCYIAASIIGKLLRTKYLLLVLLATTLVNAILWLLISYSVPGSQWESGCNSWICEQEGQIAIATLTLCNLTLLFELTTRVKEATRWTMGGLAGFISSGMVLGIGLLTGIEYAYAFLINATASILMAMMLVILAPRITQQGLERQETRCHPNFLRMLRNVFVVLLVAALGFSTMDSDLYSFDLLIEFGLGWLLLQLTAFAIEKAMGKVRSALLLEGIVYIVFSLVIATVMGAISSGNDLSLPMGLPVVIIGFGYGYLWQRIFQRAESVQIPNSRFILPMKKISSRGGAKFSLAVYFMLLFVLSIVQISIDSEYIMLIYQVGLTISLISLISWFIHLYKSWKITLKQAKSIKEVKI